MPDGTVEDSSHAEVFYFQKQIQAQTRMIVMLENGDELEGVIEWYDRFAIKLRNVGRGGLQSGAVLVCWCTKRASATSTKPAKIYLRPCRRDSTIGGLLGAGGLEQAIPDGGSQARFRGKGHRMTSAPMASGFAVQRRVVAPTPDRPPASPVEMNASKSLGQRPCRGQQNAKFLRSFRVFPHRVQPSRLAVISRALAHFKRNDAGVGRVVAHVHPWRRQGFRRLWRRRAGCRRSIEND